MCAELRPWCAEVRKRALVLAASLLVAVGPAFAADLVCEGVDARVRYDSADLVIDARLACQAARAAADFLGDHGFDVRPSIEIAIDNEACKHQHDRVLGIFSGREEEVIVMSQDACRRALANGTLFGLPFDAELYRSLVAHEVAHAIAAANFAVNHPSRLAHEYIAYVVQLATMAPRHRDRILARAKVHAYTSFSEMSETYHSLSPADFAVKVYGHFLAATDRIAVLRAVLAGRLSRSSVRN